MRDATNLSDLKDLVLGSYHQAYVDDKNQSFIPLQSIYKIWGIPETMRIIIDQLLEDGELEQNPDGSESYRIKRK
jgi:hypothetical protein